MPTSVQGRSLLPALQDQPLDRVPLAITEHAGWRSVRTPDYRYLIHADGHECLWHLRADPRGDVDISAEPAHQIALADHRRLLLQRQLQAERGLRRVWPY